MRHNRNVSSREWVDNAGRRDLVSHSPSEYKRASEITRQHNSRTVKAAEYRRQHDGLGSESTADVLVGHNLGGMYAS